MYEWGMTQLAKIRFEWLIKLFKKPSYLSENEKRELKRIFRDHNYIIASYDPYSLSGIFVCFITFLLTRKWPRYTHIFLNVETEDYSEWIAKGFDPDDYFRFVEATSIGVHPSNFDEAIGHSKRVAVLTPAYYDQLLIDDSLGISYKFVGRGYDYRYQLNDSLKMSCVELAWSVLKKLPFAKDNFRCLQMLIDTYGNLTPEMFLCPDFKIVKKVGL